MRLNAGIVISVIALLFCGLAIALALSFGKLEKADFTFNNESDVQSLDPAIVSGEPEGRIINALFEGLYRNYPSEGSIQPEPAVAASLPKITEGGRVYTIELRQDARWSDDTPVTAEDFRWSWQRCLFPGTGAKYAYQLWYIKNAKRYTNSTVFPDDRVEVELPKPEDHPDEGQPFPRGEVLYGTLKRVFDDDEKELSVDDVKEIIESIKKEKDEKEKKKASQRKENWVYEVDIDGTLRRFSTESISDDTEKDNIEKCEYLLLDFREVGVKVLGPHKLRVELTNPTPFFLNLLAFYPTYPVQRACVEKHGYPLWTKEENIVSNGPYRLQFRRVRDRIRMVKNPHYWNAQNVAVETIDALSVEDDTTALNMYLNGQIDWVTNVPNLVVPLLRESARWQDHFQVVPMLTTYFYRINVKRPGLDNVKIRRALNMAIDKKTLCESILQAGQQPARSIVPAALAKRTGYQSAVGDEYSLEKAKQLLAEAIAEDDRFNSISDLPKIEILFNTSEDHKTIAEYIERSWRKLDIKVGLKSLEWKVYLSTTHEMQYDVQRAGWIADYPDPNTFLDMWLTDGENNETGWSNSDYDKLIADAAKEPNPKKRLEIMNRAERILMDELPIIPMYFYVSKNMVRPRIKGYKSNILDLHPVHKMSLEPE